MGLLKFEHMTERRASQQRRAGAWLRALGLLGRSQKITPQMILLSPRCGPGVLSEAAAGWPLTPSRAVKTPHWLRTQSTRSS
jgi:hypothetical protein